MKIRKLINSIKGLLGMSFIILLLMLFLIGGVLNVQNNSQSENKKVVENAIKRTVIQCYALEGAYPPTIAYLENHYGLTINKTRYIVHYEAFAANIMPSVTVLERTR